MKHDDCFKNREAIEASKLCACFSCLKVFSPELIMSWTDENDTALCPCCEIDTVVPAPASGVVDMEDVLNLHLFRMRVPYQKMRPVFYGQAMIEVAENDVVADWLKSSAERTSQALEDALQFCDESNARIASKEAQSLALLLGKEKVLELDWRRNLMGICPGCGEQVGTTQLRLNAGALLKDGPQSAGANENLCGFFTLDWHDHDNSNRPSIHVAESPFPGQIELLFHGTNCLRIWFERIARKLEQ